MIAILPAGAGVKAGPFTILGMRIDTLDTKEAIGRVIAMAESETSSYCCVSNVYQVMLGHDDPAFATVLNSAAFNLTDSRVLHGFIARRYDLPNTMTLRGAELMMALCEQAAERGIPVALIGGRDDAALEALKVRLVSDYPALDIAYAFSPPFTGLNAVAERAMLDALMESRAQLVFVGLGCPKQERWMARYSPYVPATMIGVGAAFDFNSGAVRKSPPWVHATGLEWAYRLFVEPRRLWRRYLIESPRFLIAIQREKRNIKNKTS